MYEIKPKRMPFSSSLVPKVLDGTKTVTRRCHKTPRYKVGDIICISETWWSLHPNDPKSVKRGEVTYKATDIPPNNVHIRWCSSMFQPVWACRPWRGRIIDVRQERLWDIDEDDAILEGISWIDHEDEGGHYEVNLPAGTPHAESGLLQTDELIEAFAFLWDSINGHRNGYAWKDNPQVIRYQWETINV